MSSVLSLLSPLVSGCAGETQGQSLTLCDYSASAGTSVIDYTFNSVVLPSGIVDDSLRAHKVCPSVQMKILIYIDTQKVPSQASLPMYPPKLLAPEFIRKPDLMIRREDDCLKFSLVLFKNVSSL